ncbi:hypothetical protein FUAX_32150 [Fulvitalea axinellae]|uniref:Secretion system C-terminal sorting domain-containing protein n=1 Tax=Fulvitalea axinellae TaxID=1182444 RepID=A0AAU9CKS0_9BACT|nr:hypothetical protein FUAX_32150 [Fulvitalea axinellae]
MKVLAVVLLFVTISVSVSGQELRRAELVGVSGGKGVSKSYQMSWSVGETLTKTFDVGDGMILTQGVHQGESYVVLSVGKPVVGQVLRAYPNPVADYVTVELSEESMKRGKWNVSVSDSQGKAVLEGDLSEPETKLSLEPFASGVYFLRLRQEGETVKTIRLIKK